MHQIMVTHGSKKPADLHSFLFPLYEEICDMSMDGIEVKVGNEIIRAKIHLLTFAGDIPAITDLINHRGHTFRNGCRMCDIQGVSGSRGGMYFAKATGACGLHGIEQYQNHTEQVMKNIYGDVNV
jgi:hypothetical protein